jgi:hypothetical protein
MTAVTFACTPAVHAAAAAPRAGGYFQLVPPGHFAQLPSDGRAAASVHRSAWEPRPVNLRANHTMPPSTFRVSGYSGMLHHSSVFGRVTGHYTGTTDEIIQWAAVKWGLPDEVIRADAVQESFWWQDHRTKAGQPIIGQGYGDPASCSPGSPPASGYGARGPSSFGLLQVKWCTMKDSTAPGYDGWPWTERSTAYAVDFYAAVIRGCYEGWDTWLGSGYRRGDLWGCLGRWFSGGWYTAPARSYIAQVKRKMQDKAWRGWSG